MYGELRGAEARSFFGETIYGGAAKKGACTTIHFDKIEDILKRVRFEPMNVPPVYILKVDMLVECVAMEHPEYRRIIRRVTRIGEPGKELLPGEKMDLYVTWEYNMESDDILPVKNVKSFLCEKIMGSMGITPSEFIERFKEKCYVMYYLIQKNVTTGREFFNNYMSRYYAPPEEEGKPSKQKQELMKEVMASITPQIKRRVDMVARLLATQLKKE